MFSANEKSHEEKKRQEKESAHRLCFIIKTTKFKKLGTFKRVWLRSRFRCSSWLISAVTEKSGINVCIKIYKCTNITLDTQKLCKVIIISSLKSTLSDLNGFVLMFTWGLSSLVRVQANVVCLLEIPSVYSCYLSFHYAVFIKCSLSPTYHMQKYIKWEDVLNQDAHSFPVATTQICAGGHNKFLKLTKETNVEIVQLSISAWTTQVSHIFMSSRRIYMII